MPSSTFYNLPDEKREKLIMAIKEELQRVSFDQVSINKIIQTANIPRGSFYQYFEDKDDMIEYLLSDYNNIMIEEAKKSLIRNKGDIFIMLSDIVSLTVGFATSAKVEPDRFYTNLLGDMNTNRKFFIRMYKENERLVEEFSSYVDYQMLSLEEKSDFHYILEILSSIFLCAISEIFLNISGHEIAVMKFNRKLELVKNGFIKNKE